MSSFSSPTYVRIEIELGGNLRHSRVIGPTIALEIFVERSLLMRVEVCALSALLERRQSAACAEQRAAGAGRLK